MKRTIKALPVILAAVCASSAQDASAEAHDWSFDVTPYLWVASVGLDSSLPPTMPGGDPTNQRFDTRITGGAMIAGHVRYRSFGFFGDFAWLRLNTAAISPGPVYSEVNLRSDFTYSTAALTYDLPSAGKFHSELLAGARIWYFATELKATSGLLPAFVNNTEKSWADPMMGCNLRYDIAKHWSADVKGMVGGFGVSADIAGEVFAGVSYHFKDWSSATLGYRYLNEQYSQRAFNLDLEAQGFLLGFGFHF